MSNEEEKRIQEIKNKYKNFDLENSEEKSSQNKNISYEEFKKGQKQEEIKNEYDRREKVKFDIVPAILITILSLSIVGISSAYYLGVFDNIPVEQKNEEMIVEKYNSQKQNEIIDNFEKEEIKENLEENGVVEKNNEKVKETVIKQITPKKVTKKSFGEGMTLLVSLGELSQKIHKCQNDKCENFCINNKIKLEKIGEIVGGNYVCNSTYDKADFSIWLKAKNVYICFDREKTVDESIKTNIHRHLLKDEYLCPIGASVETKKKVSDVVLAAPNIRLIDAYAIRKNKLNVIVNMQKKTFENIRNNIFVKINNSKKFYLIDENEKFIDYPDWTELIIFLDEEKNLLLVDDGIDNNNIDKNEIDLYFWNEKEYINIGKKDFWVSSYHVST